LRSYNVILVFILLLLSLRCTDHKPKAYQPDAYYYWRTQYSLSQVQKDKLAKHNISELYIRFFDIDYKDDKVIIVAPIQWRDTISVDVVPVVFIKNRALQSIPVSRIQLLCDTIYNSIARIHDQPHTEIQIDCDWSNTTRQKYFLLLHLLKKRLQTHEIISSTIRLHQLKFPDMAGVPPVDKGVLMLYNMADFDKIKTKNSIFDERIINDYLGSEGKYPLQLDIALPAYQQGLLFRGSRFLTFFRNQDLKAIFNMDILSKSQSPNQYIITKDTLFQNTSFIKGDVLRYEKTDSNEINRILNSFDFKSKYKSKILFFDLNDDL
jgi:hypothetical protein